MSYPMGIVCTHTQQQIPLKGVRVNARIHDLFCDVTVEQTYENTESQPIEAVYTFPLPSDAVLLDVEVTLGDKKLHGAVVPKREAEAKYEQAIVSGDAAIRLERIEPGLYSMNLGNLLAGERAVIACRYGQLLRWNGDSVRFHLPTTVAPRYGVPQMQPHQVPEASLLVDHLYQLQMTIGGLLAEADIASPTHRIQMGHRDRAMHVGLAAGQAYMDRDFVLNLILRSGPRSAAASVADRDGAIAMLSWRPSFSQVSSIAPRAIKIVIDCSGSMNGDSIAQARIALKRIIESLRPQDHFDIVRFGNRPEVLFGKLAPASGRPLERALALAESMHADLGGTEIGDALEAACRIGAPYRAPRSDMLLITDGQVHDTGRVVDVAKSSGHRIFTVGVGASVAEALVRQLAEQTGGTCELVHPNEQMAERIVRHFQRILAPRVTSLRIDWPVSPLRQTPAAFKGIFDGDTVHAFAWLAAGPEAEVGIQAVLEDGQTVSESIPLNALPSGPACSVSTRHPLARLAASARIAESPEEKRSLALEYQLLTDVTDFLVVHARNEEEKAGELPELRTVPHMFAAGWGGVGRFTAALTRIPMDATFSDIGAFDQLEARAVLPRPTARVRQFGVEAVENPNWIGDLGQLLKLDWKTGRLKVAGIALLTSVRAPTELLGTLVKLGAEGGDVDAVVLTLLQELARMDAGKAMGRQALRVVAKLARTYVPDEALAARVREALMVVLANGGHPAAA